MLYTFKVRVMNGELMFFAEPRMIHGIFSGRYVLNPEMTSVRPYFYGVVYALMPCVGLAHSGLVVNDTIDNIKYQPLPIGGDHVSFDENLSLNSFECDNVEQFLKIVTDVVDPYGSGLVDADYVKNFYCFLQKTEKFVNVTEAQYTFNAKLYEVEPFAWSNFRAFLGTLALDKSLSEFARNTFKYVRDEDDYVSSPNLFVTSSDYETIMKRVCIELPDDKSMCIAYAKQIRNILMTMMSVDDLPGAALYYFDEAESCVKQATEDDLKALTVDLYTVDD